LPVNALQGASPDQFVNLAGGDKSVKVSVAVGLTVDQKVEITRGLTEGQIVILP
jgi:hypothetical protein